MAITNFIPEIWSSSLLVNLRDTLVYGGLTNRDYEGEIRDAGDTVRVTSFNDPSVRPYTKNADTASGVDGNPGAAIPGIQWDLLTDSQQTMVVDQSDYFAFKVDDIDRRQALSGFVEETTRGAAYNLAEVADTYVADLMVAAANGTANDLGARFVLPNDVVADEAGEGTVYDLLVDFRTALKRSKTPDSGRWVVVPPEMYALLLKDDRFIRMDASGTTEGLRNGQVGRAAGFDIIESNTVPEAAGVYSIVAGHDMATSFAEQITETEAMRLENSFSDGVRGLHLYGGKVFRPAQLALADVTVGENPAV